MELPHPADPGPGGGRDRRRKLRRHQTLRGVAGQRSAHGGPGAALPGPRLPPGVPRRRRGDHRAVEREVRETGGKDVKIGRCSSEFVQDHKRVKLVLHLHPLF